MGRSFGSSLWPGRLGAAPVHERCERPSTALTQSIEVGAVPDSGLAERMQVRAPPRVAQPLCLDPVRENERRWDQSRRALPAEMSRSHSRHPSPRASPPPREAGLPTSSGDGQPVSGKSSIRRYSGGAPSTPACAWAWRPRRLPAGVKGLCLAWLMTAFLLSAGAWGLPGTRTDDPR